MTICVGPDNDRPSPDYPEIALGSPETGDETLTLRREDGCNKPGTRAETMSKRLREAWLPFVGSSASRENYDAMAEAAKLALADFYPKDLVETFRVDASPRSKHGVDLTLRDPPGSYIASSIASLLPAEAAKVTVWSGHAKVRE